ncbi:DNA-binding XRE family transcriptional regulator [Neobacillus niacini]|uniref:hypothetical protein n=1 Tax=Neobacillus niacini TaxID=86668 RepID=UPI0027845573|nr:hypothetical protein [Neobacillus niacini]MDQ1003558.1 DNA-binding XRE family transcriptional regulator [Neobacillus niacini]
MKKLSKYEFKGIRECLGFTMVQWAEVLGVSLTTVQKTESNGASGYEVTEPLDRRVKAKLEAMNQDIEKLLEVIHSRPMKGESN